MKKKRGKLEVVYDLLKVIRDHQNSIKPTPLLRFSNLSSQRFELYVAELIKKDLIKELKDKKNRKYYSLTDNGFRYIEKYSTIVDFIDYFDL